MSNSPLNQGRYPFTNPGSIPTPTVPPQAGWPYAPMQQGPPAASSPTGYVAQGPNGYGPGNYPAGQFPYGSMPDQPPYAIGSQPQQQMQQMQGMGMSMGSAQPVRQQGPGSPMQYPQGNTFQDQFLAERTPDEMSRLDALSRQAGEQLGPQTILRPFIVPKKIMGINLNTLENPDLADDYIPGPNDQNAEFVLDYYFPFATYIRKITATLVDPILNDKFSDTLLASSSPFGSDVSALDYIEGKLERANNENIFTEYAPLSEWTGNGQLSYVWDLIPYISRAETIRITCRIPKSVPYSVPGADVLPARYYYNYISALNITLHTMRFPAP